MIRLDTTTRKLQIILAGAVTTNQLPVLVSYSDKTATTYNGGTQVSNTNSGTAVDICAAPGASTIRDIDTITVQNADTAAATATIRFNDNGTIYNILQVAFAVGDQLIYTHGRGWEVLDNSGNLKSSGGGGGGGTVTTVSVVSANGFAGTVDNATTTPAITLSTSITGVLKGNGTAISAATAGTDYAVPGANSDITSLSALTSINNDGIVGRNALMNSDQHKASYGTSATITAAAALKYVLDRWWAACTGANVAFAQVAGSGATQYLAQFTGAASVTGIQYGQRIESEIAFPYANANNIFSVELANSLLTTVTWTAYHANTADTFGTLASPTKTQIATGTFTVNSTLTKYSAAITVPAAAVTGIEIVLSVGAQTSGTFQIGKVQWELGSVATQWQAHSGIFGGDDLACMRYFQSFYFRGYHYAPVTSVWYSTTALPVTMRTDPTFTASGTWTPTNVTSVLHFPKASSYSIAVSPTASGMCGYVGAAAIVSLAAEL